MPNYLLLDFDGVLTRTIKGENHLLAPYVKTMELRKEKKIPFPQALNKVTNGDVRFKQSVYSNWFDHNILNKDILPFIKEASAQGYDLGIATNNCPQIVQPFLKIHKLDSSLSEINRFFPENLRWVWKPQPEYFKNICKYLQCDMNQLTLVDDSYENVKALKALGGNALWYDVKRRRMF